MHEPTVVYRTFEQSIAHMRATADQSDAAWDAFTASTFPDAAPATAPAAAHLSADDSAWDAFQRATFPDLTR